jgi:hypothetical protein
MSKVTLVLFFNSKLREGKGGYILNGLKDVFVCKGFGGNAVCDMWTGLYALRGLLRHRAGNVAHAFGEEGARCGKCS